MYNYARDNFAHTAMEIPELIHIVRFRIRLRTLDASKLVTSDLKVEKC